MLEAIKYGLIVITSALAVWGTLYDFKTNGKINKQGNIAIFFLGVLFTSSMFVEVMTNSKAENASKLAAEQLKKENNQRELLIDNMNEVENRINSNIKYLENLKESLLSNNSAIKLAEKNLKQASNIQLLQQKELGKEINKFSNVAKLELSRLASPIKELYLSSSFKFVDSKRLFSEYYEFLKPEFYAGEGNYGYSKRVIPQDLDLSKVHHFVPDYMELGFYKNITQEPISISDIRESKPELLFVLDNSEREDPFGSIYSNLDDGSIIKNINLKPLLLKMSKGNITSILDLTDLAEKGDYVTIRFSSTYPENVNIDHLTIHTSKSKDMGVKLSECKLLDKYSGLTYVLSESHEINHFSYKYACRLWTAKKLSL